MPVEKDRIIGELAVEQGLIGRDEATRYYSMLDSQPGTATTLAQLLVRDGRATREDLERLRDVWRSRAAAGQPGSVLRSALAPAPAPPRNGHAAPPPSTGRPRTAALPPPPMPVRSAPAGGGSGAEVSPQAWAAILKKDEILARILITRNVLTVERAREARALQLQAKSRLGPLLLKQGWADRTRLEEAIRFIREQVVTCQRCGNPQDRTRLPAGSMQCPRCGGALVPASDEPGAGQGGREAPRGAASGTSPALMAASMPPAAPPTGAFYGQKPPAFGPGAPFEPEAATFRGVPPGLGALDDPFSSARVVPGNDSRYGRPPPPFAPSGAPPPFGGAGAPPPIRLDTSQDELDPFVQKPAAPGVRRDVSQDELNIFDATAPPAAPSWARPAGPDASAYGAKAPAAQGFPPAPAESNYEDGPTTQVATGHFPPPQVGPAPSAFGSQPSSEGAAPSAFVEPSSPSGFRADTNVEASARQPGAAVPAPPEDKPAETRIDASRKGPVKQPKGKAGRGRRDEIEEPSEPRPMGRILAIALSIAVIVGTAAFVGSWLLKGRRIEENLTKADQAYDKKDWKAAHDLYVKVLADEKDNERALARRKDCDELIEKALLEDEAKERLRLSLAATDPNEAVNVLLDDPKLNEEQKRKLSARVDILVGLARAKRRLAETLHRQSKKLDEQKQLEEANAELDQAEQVKNAAGQCEAIVYLERVRLLEQRKAPNLEIAQRLSDLAQADPDGWCGEYAKGRKESPLTVNNSNAAKLEQAILQFDAALRDAPDPKRLPEAYYWRGKAKLRASASRKKEAKKDFQDGIDANPDDFRNYIELSKILLEEGAAAKEVGVLVDKAVLLAPDDPEVLALNGEVSYLQGRPDDPTYKMLSDALRVDGSLVRARRIRTYISIDRHLKAPNNPYPAEFHDDLDRSLLPDAFPDDVKLHEARARDQYAQKQWSKAIPDFDVVLAPDHVKGRSESFLADVYAARGFCYLEVHDWDKARVDCEQAVKLGPSNGRSWRDLGVARRNLQMALPALEALTTAIGLLKGEEKVQATLLRAESYAKARTYDKAIADLSDLLRDYPGSKYAKEIADLKARCEKEAAGGQPPAPDGGGK
jgi:tetratricopeptide (TPR) repeat protein